MGAGAFPARLCLAEVRTPLISLSGMAGALRSICGHKQPWLGLSCFSGSYW